jgi:hypothetical protein
VAQRESQGALTAPYDNAPKARASISQYVVS